MPKTINTANAEVQRLEEFQRQSTAIETIFTLAVLYVGILQIFTLSGMLRFAALIPVLLLIGVALLIGGENLWNQVRTEFGEAQN